MNLINFQRLKSALCKTTLKSLVFGVLHIKVFELLQRSFQQALGFRDFTRSFHGSFMSWTIKLFADDCIIYRKITKKEDIEILQKDLDRLGEWAVVNVMRINSSKSKAVRFTRARSKDPLNYSLMDTLIPEASSCKYLWIILRSDLSWADQVNYTVKKAWKALHFTMRIIKKRNSNTKSLAYMSLVRPILEYGAVCWDPYREGQISAIDRVQKSAAKFAYHTNRPNWEAGVA
jgi:hypothetical protein